MREQNYASKRLKFDPGSSHITKRKIISALILHKSEEVEPGEDCVMSRRELAVRRAYLYLNKGLYLSKKLVSVEVKGSGTIYAVQRNLQTSFWNFPILHPD